MNPGSPAWGDGELLQGMRGSSKSFQGVTPEHSPCFKYLQSTLREWGNAMNRIIIEGNRVILEFNDTSKMSKLIEVLRTLGVTLIEKKVVVRYDPDFELFLRNDKKYDERTIRDYMNYLRKLDGKELNYKLYLQVSNNKWFIKTVRLYVEYLYKNKELTWEEYNRYLFIFRVKSEDNVNNEKVDVDALAGTMYIERTKPVELTMFKVLLYGGNRFSEVVKLINEFDREKLVCFEDKGYCRYGLFWKRGKKRVDWIYMPMELVPEIERFKGYYAGRDYHNIERILEKKYGIKLGWFRKLFYRVCKSMMDKELCDFYQGRIGKLSVGDKHYDELLTKCDENYPALVKRINKVIEEGLMELTIGVPEKNVEIVLDSGKTIKTDEIPPFDIDYDPNDPMEEERDVWEFSLEGELEILNK